MHMAGDKLGEGIGDGDDGFLEVIVGHASGPPKGTGAGHIPALGSSTGAVSGHWVLQRVQFPCTHWPLGLVETPATPESVNSTGSGRAWLEARTSIRLTMN